MKNFLLSAILLNLLLALFIFCAPPALAIELPVFVKGETTPSAINDPATTINNIIGDVISIISGVIGAFALLMFVYGGVLMITSQGNPSKVDKGKTVIIWALIGLFAVFFSYSLLTLVLQRTKPGFVPTPAEGGTNPGCDAASGTCKDFSTLYKDPVASGGCGATPGSARVTCIIDKEAAKNNKCRAGLCTADAEICCSIP